jgi:putative membrane protein
MWPLFTVCKVMHVVSMVSWFAGLFYLPRLFVYDVESTQQEVQNTLRVMQRKLYRGIMTPAMILTWGFGMALAVQLQALSAPWLNYKLLWVLFLTGYHLFCGQLRKKIAANRCPFNGKQLRILNEVPAIVLIVIVGTVYSQSVAAWIPSSLVAGVLSLALMMGFVYRLKSR